MTAASGRAYASPAALVERLALQLWPCHVSAFGGPASPGSCGAVPSARWTWAAGTGIVGGEIGGLVSGPGLRGKDTKSRTYCVC